MQAFHVLQNARIYTSNSMIALKREMKTKWKKRTHSKIFGYATYSREQGHGPRPWRWWGSPSGSFERSQRSLKKTEREWKKNGSKSDLEEERLHKYVGQEVSVK
jgi:hypothetical protein